MSIPGANGCLCSKCNEWHDIIFYDSKGKSYCLECRHDKKTEALH